MNSSSIRHPLQLSSAAAALALLLALAVTRSGHFGSIVSLPDASLAVFFLLGWFLAAPGWLAVALGLAAAVDAIVITGGVNAACVTPAYIFLVPTYGALWWAGRLARGHSQHLAAPARLLMVLAAAFLGTLAAFVISNGSFYAYSGLFPNLSAADYASRVLEYAPRYFGYALMYVAIGLALAAAARAMLFQVGGRGSDQPALRR